MNLLPTSKNSIQHNLLTTRESRIKNFLNISVEKCYEIISYDFYLVRKIQKEIFPDN